MTKQEILEREYYKLLDQNGLKPRLNLTPAHNNQEILQHLEKHDGLVFDQNELKKVADTICESLKSGYHNSIKQLSREIKRGIKKENYSLNTELFVGEFPTGDFNAMAYPCSAGILVLINTGAFELIGQIVDIISYSLDFSNLNNDGLPDSATIATASSIEISLNIVEVMLGYFFTGNANIKRNAENRLKYSNNNAPKINKLTSAALHHDCLKFMMSHEYGHVIGKHLNRPKYIVRKSPIGNIKVVSNDMKQEYEADCLGVKLMISSLLSDVSESNNYEDLISSMTSTTASISFFLR